MQRLWNKIFDIRESQINKGKSVLAEHLCGTKHMHINMNHRALNRDDGSYLPQEYLHFVGKLCHS